MAELTTLEEKRGEVIGLAQAAQKATEKVEGLVDDEQIAASLRQMREEAEEAGEEQVSELVEWALPIQERHFSEVKEGSLQLAGEKDPYEEA
jgi:hypothetical protein